MVLGLLCFVRCCAVQCSVLGVRCLLLLLCGLVIHLMAWLIAACALQIGVPSRITSLKTRNPDITVGPKVLVPAIAPKKAVLASLVIEFKPYADGISEGEYDWLQKGWDAALQYDSDSTDGTKQMACLDYAAEYMKAALVKHHGALTRHVCCMFAACLPHVCMFVACVIHFMLLVSGFYAESLQLNQSTRLTGMTGGSISGALRSLCTLSPIRTMMVGPSSPTP